MYYAYVLMDSRKKLYKGMTSNLERRLIDHKRGHTVTTRKMDNPELIYKESYESFEEARKREVYFKTAAGRRFLKSKIKMDP